MTYSVSYVDDNFNASTLTSADDISLIGAARPTEA